MSNLKDIVNVQISISTPVSSSHSFGTLLIVGPSPKAPGKTPPAVAVYSDLQEVTDAGWVAIGDNADPVGIAASVAFGQDPTPTEIYIAVATVDEQGKPTNIAGTLDAALNCNGWYAIAPAGISEESLEEIAIWTEVNDKIMGFTTLSLTSPVDNTYFRTFGIYGPELPDEETTEINKYKHVAFMAHCLHYEPGSETWALKTLAMVSPSTLTGAQKKSLKDENLTYYITSANVNVTQGGKTCAGEWIDVIRFRDWLQNDMQMRVFNYMRTRPKAYYTDKGITDIENQMKASLQEGTDVGGIAPDEFDADGNVVKGFTTSVPRSAEVNPADKAERVLTNCKFSARLAGAIHATNISGVLGY